MRILFISHSYPPIIGGVENQNYNLSKGLERMAKVKILANTRGKKWLPVFLVVTFFKSVFLMRKCDVCLLGNGVVAPIGFLLKIFFRKKGFFCVVHGLDVTYANREGFLPKIYKALNISSMKKMDQLFMVGNATIEEAVKAKIERSRCTFIPNGVDCDELKEEHSRKELSELFGKKTEDKTVILRLGRFVPHKGTSWFIRNVMPFLDEKIVMIAAGNRVNKNTAGDQDDFLECERAIVEKNLEKKIRLLPSLPWKDVLVLLNTVDIVVSPNIQIPGTMEGFGINVIEAGACGRIVLASNLEGLADAVKDGQNGFLVDPENPTDWINKINAVVYADPQKKRSFGIKTANYVQEYFGWEKICSQYLDEMEKYTNK